MNARLLVITTKRFTLAAVSILMCVALSGCSSLSKEEGKCLETIKVALYDMWDGENSEFASFGEWGERRRECLDSELKAISSFKEAEFENQEFKDTVHRYVSAVESERKALNLIGKDSESFTRLYHDEGVIIRNECLGLFEKKYGLRIDGKYADQRDKLRQEANLISLDFDKPTKVSNDCGEISLVIDGYHMAGAFDGDRFGRLTFEAENISYSDKLNPGYVQFDKYITIESADGMEINPSSMAGEYGEYAAAAGAFAELGKGEKKKFCTEYLQEDDTDMVKIIIGGDNAKYVTYLTTSSPVERAYRFATSIPVAGLNEENDSFYSYEGIQIANEDAQPQFGDTLNQGAVYHSYAKRLEQYYANGEEGFSNLPEELLVEMFNRKKPESYAEFLKAFDPQLIFVSSGYPVGEMMNALSRIDECNGTFDFAAGYFNFRIEDLESAAESLGLSDSMLGYILAWLSEYSTEVAFAGNSCTVSLTYQRVLDLSEDDFAITKLHGDSLGTAPGEYAYTVFAADLAGSIPESEKDQDDGFYITSRGVMLGQSKNAVLMSYGNATAQSFNPSSDELCANLTSDGLNNIRRMMDQAVAYLVYTYEDLGQLLFFFDKNDRLVAFATLGLVAY